MPHFSNDALDSDPVALKRLRTVLQDGQRQAVPTPVLADRFGISAPHAYPQAPIRVPERHMVEADRDGLGAKTSGIGAAGVDWTPTLFACSR